MNSARLTIGLLVLAAVLAAVVPAIRSGVLGWVRSMGSPRFPTVDEARGTAAGTGDAGMRLACAEYARSRLEAMDLQIRYGQPGDAANAEGMWGPAPTREQVDEAYRAAIEAAPRDPAAHLRYAIFLAGRVGQVDLEAQPTALTAEEQRALAGVREQAEAARRLAPENAAADCLLAWAATVEGDRQAMLREASQALQRSGFSTYEGQVMREWARLVDHAGRGTQGALSFASTGPEEPLAFGPGVRRLARALQALGDEYRHAGDHGQAIVCYETVVHLGRLMREHAFSVIDGLLGAVVTQMAAGSPDWAPGPGAAPEDEADRAVRTAQRTSGLAGYFAAHGRADLAEQYRAEVAAAMAFRDAAREWLGGIVEQITTSLWAGGAPYALAAWMLFAVMALAGALIGLASLAARYWREPTGHPGWRHVQWLSCLAVALMGPIAGATLLWWTLASPEGPDPAQSIPLVLLASTASGVAGWCAAVWVQAMRRRAHLPEDQRLGRARSWLRGMRALIAPTLAALVVLSVLGVWPVQRNLDRTEQEMRRIAVEGEVAYYGLADDGR